MFVGVECNQQLTGRHLGISYFVIFSIDPYEGLDPGIPFCVSYLIMQTDVGGGMNNRQTPSSCPK